MMTLVEWNASITRKKANKLDLYLLTVRLTITQWRAGGGGVLLMSRRKKAEDFYNVGVFFKKFLL